VSNERRLTRGRTRRGPASVRRPSRLGKSKSERRRAACIARLTCRQAVRRAAVATWALAARVNLWTVSPTDSRTYGSFPEPMETSLANAPFLRPRRQWEPPRRVAFGGAFPSAELTSSWPVQSPSKNPATSEQFFPWAISPDGCGSARSCAEFKRSPLRPTSFQNHSSSRILPNCHQRAIRH
jgi:hypothetical protein